jgi:DNA-binding transcriptional LysR family regulator
LSPKSEGRRILDSTLEAEGLRPASTIDVPSVILMLSYVRAGVGVGLFPALALQGSTRTLAIERARVPARPVTLITRASYRPSEVAGRFLRALEHEAARAAAARRRVGSVRGSPVAGARDP